MFPLMGIFDKRLLLLHYPDKSETFVPSYEIEFFSGPLNNKSEADETMFLQLSCLRFATIGRVKLYQALFIVLKIH